MIRRLAGTSLVACVGLLVIAQPALPATVLCVDYDPGSREYSGALKSREGTCGEGEAEIAVAVDKEKGKFDFGGAKADFPTSVVGSKSRAEMKR